MSNEPKQYTLLRKLLKALGLSDERTNELLATIQSWLADDKEGSTAPQFPYHLRDDFLSPAELNFYQALDTAVSDWATIFTKVNLGDLFYASTGDFRQDQVYRNRINRKHVDFLLCDPKTFTPTFGVEIVKPIAKNGMREADKFIEELFTDAGIPLVHIPSNDKYEPSDLIALFQLAVVKVGSTAAMEGTPDSVPSCPECGKMMVLRVHRNGPDTGKEYYGCIDSPSCPGVVQIR